MTTTPTTPTEVVTTHELNAGDVVHVYGMRVKLGAMRQTSHELNAGGATFASHGAILNPEYLQSSEGRYLFGGIIARDGSDSWTVQGNGFATWAREVSASVTA